MPKLKLTSKFIEGVKAETRTEFWDDICRGLVLRVSPGGVKSWTVVFTPEGAAKQRVTIGTFPAVSLEAARGKALKIMADVAEGHNPAEKRRLRREAMTVTELATEFVDKYSKPNKKSWQQDERMLKVDVLPLIGQKKAAAVIKFDIFEVIDRKADAGKMAQARLVFAVMRKMFAWATQRDIVPSSPMAGLKAPGKLQSRDRVLADKELAVIWNSLDDAEISQPMRDVIRILMLTGQRAGEVCGILYGEIDFDKSLWTIPANRAKNGRQHEVPLSDAVLEVIDAACSRLDEPNKLTPLFSRVGSPFESNAVSKAVRLKLQGLKNVEGDWTPHDLRRSCATGMAELGIVPHVIEAVLNHISGSKAGVAGVYNRSTYQKEKRQALQLWGVHVLQVACNRKNVVLQMKKPG